jgi:hypothetical protein
MTQNQCQNKTDFFYFVIVFEIVFVNECLSPDKRVLHVIYVFPLCATGIIVGIAGQQVLVLPYLDDMKKFTHDLFVFNCLG